MNNNAGNLKVTSVGEDTILLQVLGHQPNAALAHDKFSGEAGAGLQVENFYLATLGEAVVGVASDTDADRSVVAALVGNWISSGYTVSNFNRKDMLKKLRILTLKKEENPHPGEGSESLEVDAETEPNKMNAPHHVHVNSDTENESAASTPLPIENQEAVEVLKKKF